MVSNFTMCYAGYYLPGSGVVVAGVTSGTVTENMQKTQSSVMAIWGREKLTAALKSYLALAMEGLRSTLQM